MTHPPRHRGFTLTELAVVLLIVGLLVGGMLLPLAAQDDLRRSQETQRSLDEIRDALLGFAVANGRLPCPDIDLDGMEDCAQVVALNSPLVGQTTITFSCAAPCEGILPFATVGVAHTDSWNNRFRYLVTPAFASVARVVDTATGTVLSMTPGFSLAAAGNLSVETRGDNPATAAVETKSIASLVSNSPAVVLSHGRNGSGAVTVNGLVLPILATSGDDETANASNGTIKRLRAPTPSAVGCSDPIPGQPFCEFDDLVVWLSPNILFNRMISAGRLP